MGGNGLPATPILLLTILFVNSYCNPVNISLQSVPDSLVQSAINSLNANSPTQHTYRGGNLISAQKLVSAWNVIRLYYPLFKVYQKLIRMKYVCFCRIFIPE